MNYDEINKLILNNLNNNPYGVIFDVEVFNSPNHDYEIEVNRNDGYGVDVKRVVPTMISAPFGDNLPIPNTYGVDGSMEILFDLFIGDETKFIDKTDEEKFKSVNYLNTISSIQEFILNTLSKVQNLGNVSLFMGGEDSLFTANGTQFICDTVYLELEPQDNFEESLFKSDSIEIIRLNTGNIRLTIDTVTVDTNVTLSPNVKEKLLLWHNGTNWYINDDTTNFITKPTQTVTNMNIGNQTGLNAKVYDIRLGSNNLQYSETYDIETVSWNILFVDFDDVDNVINYGETTLWDGSCDNTILWGEDGNILLGFTTLVPYDSPQIDMGYKYQKFSLSVPFLYTKDIIFGNHFRYFLNLDNNDDGVFDNLDDFEVFAIDRQHTYGSEVTSKQGITANIGKSIVNESMRDISKTFIYKPNRNMTKLLKKIMTEKIEQNKRYRLKVQAPFFTTYYECIVESGGNGTELYSFSTFTLQLKEVMDFDE